MIDNEQSFLTSNLLETPPASYAELIEILDGREDVASSSKFELAAMMGEDNPLFAFLEQADCREKLSALHDRLALKGGGEFLRLWKTLDNLDRAYDSRLALESVIDIDEATIDELVDQMQRVPGLPGTVDLKYLKSGVKEMVAELRQLSGSLNLSELPFVFLRSLLHYVMGRIEAPGNFWEILLLKLESRFLPDSLLPEMSPFFIPFRIATANTLNQPALYEFCLLSEEMEGAQNIVANIATLAFVGAAPSQYRRDLYMNLDAAFFYSLDIEGPFTEKSAPWQSALHKRLERSFADLFIAANDRAVTLRGELSTLVSESQARQKISKAIAADLSQGMKGEGVAERINDNCERLMNAAACAHLLSATFIEAQDLFIPTVIAELGIGPQFEIWRKHSQLLSGLSESTREMNSELDWQSISKLFVALDQRVVVMHTRPIAWMATPKAIALSNAQLAESEATFLQKTVQLVTARICLEERLYGGRWKQTIKRWIVSELFSADSPYDPVLLEDLLEAQLRNAEVTSTEGGLIDDEYLLKQAQTLAHGLARIAAAAMLFQKSDGIASNVAEQVMLALPEYAEKVGEAGRISCHLDNRTTLLKVAELLLESDEDPTEQLSDWWTSLIGSYLATRPQELFKANLSSLYRNIGDHLSEAHTDTVFGPLQAMYNESLGVNCIEAMASRPLNPIGHVIEQKLSVAMESGLSDLLEVHHPALETIKVEGLAEGDANRLHSIFTKYHRSVWSLGSDDLAAAHVLPQLSRVTASPQTSAYASALIVATEQLGQGAAATLIQHSAHAYANLVMRARIADLIHAHAADIASYFSEGVITFAAEHFEHLERSAAIAKCKRDQSLLFLKVASCFKSSTPDLAWFDLTRYFLELQSPFVDYPERLWALSLRTLSKYLGKFLTPAENCLLVQMIDQGESLAAVWSGTHEIAKSLFDPTDYSFAAKPEIDLMCRDLLTAIVVADAFGGNDDNSRLSFMNRFYVSSRLNTLATGELQKIVDIVRDSAAGHLSNQQEATLSQVVRDVERLKSAFHSSESALDCYAKIDPVALQMKRLSVAPEDQDQLTIDSSSPVDADVLTIFLRVSRRMPESSSVQGSKEGVFASVLSVELLQYLLAHSTTPAVDFVAIHKCLLQAAGTQVGGADYLVRIASLQDVLSKALDAVGVISSSEETAESFLEELKAGEKGPYNSGGTHCANTTRDGFAYTFKTAAVASVCPSVSAPKIFFGRASENQKYIDLSVAANAHSRTCIKLTELLPNSAMSAFDLVADRVATQGVLWNRVAYSKPIVTESALQEGLVGINRLTAGATGCEEGLIELFSLYASQLNLHGDWEAALEHCISLVNRLLQEYALSEILATSDVLSVKVGSSFQVGDAVFWKLQLSHLANFASQVALGVHLMEHAENAASAYVATKYSSVDEGMAPRCYRDQFYMLKMIGTALSSLSPCAARLNVLKSHVDYVLPHLKNSSLELEQNWVFYEQWFNQKLPVELRPVALDLFGHFGQAYGRSVKIQGFIANSLNAVAEDMASGFGLRPYAVRDFLAGLCASSLLESRHGASEGLHAAERLLLGAKIPSLLSPSEHIDFIASIEGALETHSGGKVPNSLKRFAMELPKALGRVTAATEAEGSNMARFFIANAHSSKAEPMWRASNFARCSLDSRCVEPERNDALVARALSVDLPEDDLITKELAAYKRFMSALGAVELASSEKKGLLGGLFGKGKKTDVDWRNSPKMRAAVENVFAAIVLNQLLRAYRADFTIFCQKLTSSSEMQDRVASIEIYGSLHRSLATSLGEEHPLILCLDGFIASLADFHSSHELVSSGQSADIFWGLHAADIRSVDQGIAYFAGANPSESLTQLHASSTLQLSEGLVERLKLSAAEINLSLT